MAIIGQTEYDIVESYFVDDEDSKEGGPLFFTTMLTAKKRGALAQAGATHGTCQYDI